MKDMEMDLIVGSVEFEGTTAHVFMTCENGEEDLGEWVLPDFVPNDYNVKEIIVGGYETPDYKEIVDEDYTIEEWWSECEDKEFMIKAHISKHVADAMKITHKKLGKKLGITEPPIKTFEVNVSILD